MAKSFADAVEEAVQHIAKQLHSRGGLFWTRPSVYVSGVLIKRPSSAKQEDRLDTFWGLTPGTAFTAFLQDMVRYIGKEALSECWGTGADVERSDSFLWWHCNAVAIQRDGITVAVADSRRTIEELKAAAEQYCRQVLALTTNT